MSRKFLYGVLCFCFYVVSFQAAENQPKKQIKNIDQLRKEVNQHFNEADKQVRFAGVPTRKGPRIDGDPVQTKDKKEAS